ncbi:NAD(P)-binding protein [Marasmius fiardii PR-910]|nr:NAD(P)-binding protein [Marasmius fiardii PR-910]
MASTAGIAILGAGLFPALALSNLRSSSTYPPLKAVYSRSQKSATGLAEEAKKLSLSGEGSAPDVYFDQPPTSGKNLDALLSRSDISAVIIALPITVQPSIILKALKAGKHVLSEKPVAASVKIGLELIRDAKHYTDQGLVWRVAENFEVEPVYVKVREFLRGGKIGEVKSFKASVKVYLDEESEWYKTPWRTTPEYQGGFLLDGGVHTSAALRIMLPDFTSSQLVSFASLNKPYLAPKDTVHAILKTPKYNGTLDFTWAWPVKPQPNSDETIIMGSQGYIGIARRKAEEGGGWNVTMKSLVSGSNEYKETEETYAFRSQGVWEEFKAFFDVVFGGGGEAKSPVGSFEIGDPMNALFDVAFIQGMLDSDGTILDLGELWKTG